MAITIDNWNIKDPSAWYVEAFFSSTSFYVYIYKSRADQIAGTNYYGYWSGTAGTGKEVVLSGGTALAVKTAGIERFQETYSWHMVVSGQVGDTEKNFKVGPFSDLPDIIDPIYANPVLVQSRGVAEIDRHTHAEIRKNIALGSHLPTLDVGDIFTLDSARRGKSETMQVLSHAISASIGEGGEMKITSNLEGATYLELKR